MIAVRSLFRGDGHEIWDQAASSGSDTTADPVTFTDIDNQSITITTYGRPVFIFFSGDPSSANTEFQGNLQGTARLRVTRDGTVIYDGVFDGSGGGTNGRGHPFFFLFDEVAAGSHTYVAQDLNPGSNIEARHLQLTVYEMGS